jgi:hypothetical protein
MNTEGIFFIHHPHMQGVDFTFASLDRHLTDNECEALVEKYIETHHKMTLPGEVLWIDLRPAFQKPLADVTPKLYRVERKTVTSPK